MKRLRIRFRIEGGSPAVTLIGRNAWALQQLKTANDNGCTPIDNPGPRWSAYVHNLRKLGLVIETISERHDGPFAGEHARYVLRTNITIEQCTADSEAK